MGFCSRLLAFPWEQSSVLPCWWGKRSYQGTDWPLCMSLVAAGGTFPPTPTGKADRVSSRERNHREEEIAGDFWDADEACRICTKRHWALKLGRISFNRQNLNSKIPGLSLSLRDSSQWSLLWAASRMERDRKPSVAMHVLKPARRQVSEKVQQLAKRGALNSSLKMHVHRGCRDSSLGTSPCSTSRGTWIWMLSVFGSTEVDS